MSPEDEATQDSTSFTRLQHNNKRNASTTKAEVDRPEADGADGREIEQQQLELVCGSFGLHCDGARF